MMSLIYESTRSYWNEIYCLGSRKTRKEKGQTGAETNLVQHAPGIFSFFEIVKSTRFKGARGFILSDMKYCANQRALLKRIDGLEKKVQLNAPILNQPPPKCKGRKCKKKGKSG